MDRIIVAFESKTLQDKIVGMLQQGGLGVRGSFYTGSEVIRAINQLDGGVVVCGYKLRDMTAETLASDLDDGAAILVIAPNTQLQYCDSGNIFTLPTPISPNLLNGSVRMLLQMQQRRRRKNVRQRSEGDKAVIEQAKAILMENQSITEAQAHHLLQKRSMESGIRLIDVSMQIINDACENALF